MSSPKLIPIIPTIALIVAPFRAGKSKLLEYLFLDRHEDFVCVVIISNTGKQGWDESYSWLCPVYIYDSWNPDIWEEMKKLGTKVKKNNPNHHIALVFDDSIGTLYFFPVTCNLLSVF